MKVAIVTQGYQSAGGVQAVARWLLAGLESNGDTVTVLNIASARGDRNSRSLLRPATWLHGPQLIEDPERSVYQVGTALSEIEPLRYLPTQAFLRTLEQQDAVVVVAGAPALANLVRGFPGPKVLQVATRAAWERESIHRAAPPARALWGRAMTAFVGLLEVRAMRGVDTILVENPDMLREVESQAPEVNAAVAFPGIDCRRYESSAAWRSDGPIVSVGRLGEARKGWSRMLEIYANLIQAEPAAPPLIIAGRGDLSASDRSTLEELQLDGRVEVRNDLPFDELRELLHSASVFWQTSYEEGLGIAVIEGMAAGLPVVATRTAGTEMSVVDGMTGFVIDQDSRLTHEFVAKTRTVLANGAAMGQRSARRAQEEFDSSVTIGAFVEATRTPPV